MTLDSESREAQPIDTSDRADLQKAPRAEVRKRKTAPNKQRSGNRIFQGQNLDVLKMLADTEPNTIRCAYLDPPYNNGESYRHYFDSMDRTEWLQSIVERLGLIKRLLTPDGSVWISIDDSEVHYLKVAADNVFGRENFVSTIVWERRTTRENRRAFSRNHEYLLVYALDAARWTKSRNSLEISDDVESRYRNPDSDPRGPWQSVSANVQDGHATKSQYYAIRSPSGKLHQPPKGRCWVYSKEKMLAEISGNNVWFGKNGDGVPRLKSFLASRRGGVVPETLWRASDVGTTAEAKKELLRLFEQEVLFDTPKPERLLHRVIGVSTNPGDTVLDAYLGSGTTAAVAHKMGRRYVGIELGEHAKTHCLRRIKSVIEGESGGVSKVVGWRGGGAVDFIRLKKSARGK